MEVQVRIRFQAFKPKGCSDTCEVLLPHARGLLQSIHCFPKFPKNSTVGVVFNRWNHKNFVSEKCVKKRRTDVSSKYVPTMCNRQSQQKFQRDKWRSASVSVVGIDLLVVSTNAHTALDAVAFCSLHPFCRNGILKLIGSTFGDQLLLIDVEVLDGSHLLVHSCNLLFVVELGVVPKYGFCCAKCLKFFFSVNIGLNWNVKSTLGGNRSNTSTCDRKWILFKHGRNPLKFRLAPWDRVRSWTLQVGLCRTNTLKQVRRLIVLCLITKFVGSSFQAMLWRINCWSSVRLLNGQRRKSLTFRCLRKYENVSVLASTFRIPRLRLEVLQQLLVNLFGNRKSANAPYEHSRSGSDNMHVSGSVSSQPQTRDPTRIGFGLLSAKSTQHNLTKFAKCRSIAFAPTTFKRSQAIGSNCKVV